jgi:cysteine-rich repeat protein
VIGDEGGLLEAPVNGVGQLTIGPGERYDVVVDFAGYNNGDEILLQNSAGAPFPTGPVDLTQVMMFRVVNQPGDTDPLPSTLRAVPRLDPAQAVITRDFRLKQSGTDGCGRSVWEINGMHWDDIMEYPELGTSEIWRFVNDSGVSHPMHMHLVMFQILDRDGFTTGPGGVIIPNGSPQPPSAEQAGWKDTVMVGPNELARVIARFEDYKGRYPYHCHILEHEDHEMMRQFQTVSCGDGILDAPAESCDDGGKASLDGCSARCRTEEFVDLSGTALGGSVLITISGRTPSVTTSAGQGAASVAIALASQINADASLQALGVVATAAGTRVVVEAGHIADLQINDAGLGQRLTVAAGSSGMWWSTIQGAASYDLVRGNLKQAWRTHWNFADPAVTQACLANDRLETFWQTTGSPAPGDGFWYVLRAQPGGTYDSGSSQVGSRDPGIAASGNGCP